MRDINIDNKLTGMYTPVKVALKFTANKVPIPQHIDINDRLNGRLFFPM